MFKKEQDVKKIYEVPWDTEAKFIDRPNRFVANVRLEDGSEEIVHVHDSGRLQELLFPENNVKIRRAENPNRKTKWDMISAEASDGEDILINSAHHRYISQNLLNDPEVSPFGEVDSLKAEVKYGKSRIDYLLEKNGEKIWVEIKGVSLSMDRVAAFPDAPSVRAVKHLNELIELKEAGNRAAVVLLVLRSSDYFRPKWEPDPKFSDTFYEAIERGVEIYPLQFELVGRDIIYKGMLPIGEKEQY